MKTTKNSGQSATVPPLRPRILLTGATGNIGRELTKQLAQQGIPFRVMVRQANDATDLLRLPTVEVVEGDFDNATSLTAVLTGIERAFLLTPSSEQAEAQQLRFVAAAQRAGVGQLVKLSQLAANTQSPVRFLRYHAVVEQAIQPSGMTYTFLRPNLFMQGLLGFRAMIAQGTLAAPIGDARISLIDVRDIAAVAATALTQTGHENQTYTLTGPQSLTHADLAATLSAALHHPVNFLSIPSDALLGELARVGFPTWQAEGLVEDYAHYSRNEAALLTPTVADITGQSPRPFAQFASDYAAAFM